MMDYIVKSVIILWFTVQSLKSANSKVEEYCATEKFHPTCRSNEIILIEHALYGRMKIGRCVNAEVGFCSANVLKWMDKTCSGKNECEIEIQHRDLNEIASCGKDYSLYLEASYSCVSVLTPKAHSSCSTSNTIPVTSRKTSLSSSTTRITSCGLPSSPWTLEAKPGQQINITMIDFNWKTGKSSRNDKQCLLKYGYIIDVHTNTVSNDIIDICGGQSRYRNIYISHGNLIQVILEESVLQDHSFVLQLQAIGCPDFNPPRNAWMKKEDKKVTIGCHESDDQWVLRCQGTRWIGKYDNCPEDVPVVANNREERNGLPNVISLSLIAGVTAVICCVAVTSIIVCFCYRKYKVEKSEPEYYTTAVTDGNPTLALPSGTIISYKSYRPVSTVDNRQTLGTRRSVNTNNPFQTNTLTGQVINTSNPEESNMIDEVIYDDPANLDINNIDNNVEYVNQFNTVNSTGTGIVNSLQYTKLQKQNM